MTTTQHTAGPWHIARRSHAEKRILVTKDGERVLACCSTGYEGKRGPIPEPERLANARLIAAAPLMLDALRAALQAIGDTYEARDNDAEDLRDIIAGAIATATGQEVQP